MGLAVRVGRDGGGSAQSTHSAGGSRAESPVPAVACTCSRHRIITNRKFNARRGWKRARRRTNMVSFSSATLLTELSASSSCTTERTPLSQLLLLQIYCRDVQLTSSSISLSSGSVPSSHLELIKLPPAPPPMVPPLDVTFSLSSCSSTSTISPNEVPLPFPFDEL